VREVAGLATMNRFFSRHKKLAASLLLVCSVFVWEFAAPIRGNLAARFDLARGRYRILNFGLPPGWLSEYARLLRDGYGVELDPVAGCVVSHQLVSYVEAYDNVSATAAIRKYWHDIFKECAEEAEKKYELTAATKTLAN
jgi:hypothetical protein